MTSLLRRLRERKISTIESRVNKINEALEGIDPFEWPEDRYELEEERKRLWLRRSDLIKKNDKEQTFIP